MALIHGMDVFVATSASTMGNDGFRVLRLAFLPGTFDAKKYMEAQRINPQLSKEEYAFVKNSATLSREIGISAQRSVKLTYSGDLVDGVILLGFSENGPLLSNTQIDQGRSYTEIEDQHKAEVVVLGSDFKNRFFPNTDAIGKSIAIDGLPFEVIGVAQSKGSLFGQSQDNFVSIPIETYFKLYGSNLGITYNFMALDRDRLEQAEDEIRVLLRSFRHLGPQQDDTFAILSSDSLVSAWDSITGTLAAAAVGIVSVFMVVGGVVIMNIMLAVVTERTREIGVRKSVGARRQDIMNQFLVESSTLAGMGGLIGVTIAWLLAVLVRNYTPVPMDVPVNAVVVGVLLSTVVGLFFGIYPARRASQLDPIVALRSEN
jgi:putative ABC transport system permease protein